MVYDFSNPGSVTADGKTFAVGQMVKGTENTEFKNCRGSIFEIRTDDDMETENESPDIYVDFFDADYTEEEQKKIEADFSDLYGFKKTFDTISLDYMICSTDEIEADDSQPLGDADAALSNQMMLHAEDERAMALLNYLLNKPAVG